MRLRSILQIRLNKRLLSFLICLFVSALCWFLTTFKETYTSVVHLPIVYINFPKSKLITNRLPTSLATEISASGFSILALKFQLHPKPIVIDLHEIKYLSRSTSNGYIVLNEGLTRINHQLKDNIAVIKIEPDTLYFSLSRKTSRLIPIKIGGQFTLKNGLHLMDSLTLDPNKIMVTGPEEIIPKLKSIETDVSNVGPIGQSCTIKLKLKYEPEWNNLIAFDQATVDCKINVVAYTETILNLPVVPEHVPTGASLKTFPNMVQVTVAGPIQTIKSLDKPNILAKVDYYRKLNNKKLRIEIINLPRKLTVSKINPEKVEYILVK